MGVSRKRKAARAVIFCGVVLAALFAFAPAAPNSPPARAKQPPPPLPQPAESLPAPADPGGDTGFFTVSHYPPGVLLRSSRREAYVSGEMVLEIPRLSLVSPVLAGTDEQTLNQGVCLFEYAQLPGVSNSNTSLVAHRDIYGKEFLYLDTLTGGDRIYLTYQGKTYTYEYLKTWVTDPSDWDPIKVQDFACITLQTCDPVGLATNRLFVTAKLVQTQDTQDTQDPA